MLGNKIGKTNDWSTSAILLPDRNNLNKEIH